MRGEVGDWLQEDLPREFSDARERGGFVFGEIEHGIQADHLQQHQHTLAGREISAFPAGAFHQRVRTDERSDPRAIQIGNSRQIDGDMQRSAVHQLLDLAAESLFVFAELQRAFEVKNRGRTSLADSNIHVAPLCSAKLTELRLAIKAPVRFLATVP